MNATAGIIGGEGRELEGLARGVGLRPSILQQDVVAGRPSPAGPDIVLVDVRADASLVSMVPALKRRYPNASVAIVATVLDPALMLDAMRAGVNEVLSEPLSTEALRAAVERLVVPKSVPTDRRLIAIVGAKGGVGATTVAVNLSEVMVKTMGEALLIDLQVGAGDTAVFLGVEPRFTVIEALENTNRLDAAFFRGLLVRTKSGLDLLGSTARVVHGSVDPQRVRTLLDFATSFCRCVVLDVPRHDLGLLESLDATTSIFVVVNQELPTIRSAHPLVKRLQQRYGERVALLVNRSDRSSEISLDDITRAISAPIRHVFPNDYRQAMSAANRGQPLVLASQGRLAESFQALASSLTEGVKQPVAAEESGRLFGWLSARK